MDEAERRHYPMPGRFVAGEYQRLQSSIVQPNELVPFKLAQAEANISNVVFGNLSP